ncbi:hypothetical protein MHF_0704 [Mycoplasma haemofelis Ohio2]|uniref:Uncharacterized protein n=1 Tax=Mycoplasma haemofelis (strain Ohio2) TaxID=859194 RepID=F6FIC6_MYCHI|nr:hypothetical protein MHF_0704 [Mycoplasma haemofelis Ohio2]
MASGGDFDSIEKACLSNAGKDIFVSNRGGWGYHEQDQNSPEHRNKFNQYLEKLNSKQ